MSGDNFSGGLVDHRVDVEFERALEHSTECFQNSALQIQVILFIENFHQTRDSHNQADHFAGITREIPGEPIVFAKLRDQNGSPESAENIYPRQKIGVVQLAFGKEVLQCHLHEHDQVRLTATGFRQKLPAGPVQHVI